MPPKSRCIVSLLDRYETAKLSEGVLPKTLKHYRFVLCKFVEYLHVHHRASANRQDVESFLCSLRQHDPPLSTFRIRNYWVALRSFYTWAENEGLVKVNPMYHIKAPKLAKTVIEIYTPNEIRKMLAQCNCEQQKVNILILAMTGIRATELVNCKPDDIDLASHTIKVQGKGNKQRLVPFNRLLGAVLEPYLDDVKSGKVHPSITSYQGAYASVKRICHRAGVRYRGLHCFRHGFACFFIKAGGSPLSLQNILGHTTLANTQRYCQWNQKEIALDDYHKIFDPPIDRL